MSIASRFQRPTLQVAHQTTNVAVTMQITFMVQAVVMRLFLMATMWTTWWMVICIIHTTDTATTTDPFLSLKLETDKTAGTRPLIG
jgi:hypothetical protein